MRIFLIANCSPSFLNQHYQSINGPTRLTFFELENLRVQTNYHPADYYAKELSNLGHEARVGVLNDYYLQTAWAHESRTDYSQPYKYCLEWRKKLIPWISKKPNSKWIYEILRQQIQHFKPDIIYNTAVLSTDLEFLKEVKPYCKLLVGQHAAIALDPYKNWGIYDLFISSFQPTIERLRSWGLKAQFVRLGFEPYVLHDLSTTKKIDISFVGAFQNVHQSRKELIEYVCQHLAVDIWAPKLNAPSNSPLWKHYRGTAYGRKMFEILASSRITLNHHGDVLPYANNMRLYEATGVGALLVTDYKANLPDLFVLDQEVVAYENAESCVDLITYYIEHPAEAEKIARAGQARTLKDHTYHQRMQEVTAFIQDALQDKAG